MRVGFYTSLSKGFGGSEVLWLSAASEALSRGHEVKVSIPKARFNRPEIRELSLLGAKIHTRRASYPNVAYRIYKKLVDCIWPNWYIYYQKQFLSEVDVVVFNLAAGSEMALCDNDLFRVTKRSVPPYIVLAHELWIERHSFNPDMLRRLENVFRGAAKVLFTSRFACSHVSQFIDLESVNVEIMRHPSEHWTALLRCPPSEDCEFTRSHRMLALGKIQFNRKGQDILLDVLSNWDNSIFDLSITFVGDGPDRDKLLLEAESLGLEDSTDFRAPSRSLAELAKEFNVALFPSRSDTGPITLFEMMAAAKVCVCSPVGLAHDEIIDGENGFLAADMTETAFREAILRCLSMRAQWNQIGFAARETVSRHYRELPERKFMDQLESLSCALN